MKDPKKAPDKYSKAAKAAMKKEEEAKKKKKKGTKPNFTGTNPASGANI